MNFSLVLHFKKKEATKQINGKMTEKDNKMTTNYTN